MLQILGELIVSFRHPKLGHIAILWNCSVVNLEDQNLIFWAPHVSMTFRDKAITNSTNVFKLIKNA